MKKKLLQLLLHLCFRYIKDLYFQTLKYLYDSNLIDRVKPHIPYETSRVRFLISTKPYHQTGKPFVSCIEYKEYYMEAHKDYKNALNHLQVFLKNCGILMDIKDQ